MIVTGQQITDVLAVPKKTAGNAGQNVELELSIVKMEPGWVVAP